MPRKQRHKRRQVLLPGLAETCLLRPLHGLEGIRANRASRRRSALKPIRYGLEHCGGAIIVGLWGGSHGPRQFEARQLQPIFERRHPHQEECPQPRLPAADLIAHREIAAQRRPKFEEDGVGKSPHLIELCADGLA
jgi:hypothetical protein